MSVEPTASPPEKTPPPPSLLPPEEAWAAALAAEIRLALVAGADESRAAREQGIEELVRARLQPVAPSQRSRHLECLEQYFPTGLFAPPAPGKEEEPPAGSPEELARQVEAAWKHYSPEQRETFLTALARRGIAAPASTGDTAFDPAEVRQRFGLGPDETIAAQRLGRLSVHQMEFLSKLEQLAWNTWRALAPRSAIRRDNTFGDLRTQTRRYLKGDVEPTDLQIAQQIERTRQLIAMLLGSMSQISRGFAKRHRTRYAPEAIQDLVKMEGAGTWGLETKCWRKYNQLADEINEATIQNEMQEVVVKYVEDLMRGTARGAG